jgi:hypothetical protein
MNIWACGMASGLMRFFLSRLTVNRFLVLIRECPPPGSLAAKQQDKERAEQASASSMTLNTEQLAAVAQVLGGKNIVAHGDAQTGKVRHFDTAGELLSWECPCSTLVLICCLTRFFADNAGNKIGRRLAWNEERSISAYSY